MLAADADFQVGARLASFIDADFHELADTALIDRGEGVGLDDLERLVRRQEGRSEEHTSELQSHA